MAKYVEKITDTNENYNKYNNVTEYPNTFKRQGAFPLEQYSVFSSFEAAQDYATNSLIAYVGQEIAVTDEINKTTTFYGIVDTEGTLKEIGFKESIMEVINSLNSKLDTKIEYIALNSVIQPVENKTVNIPMALANKLGLVKSSNKENRIKVISEGEDAGEMEVNSLNLNKLVQTESDVVVFNAGTAVDVL